MKLTANKSLHSDKIKLRSFLTTLYLAERKKRRHSTFFFPVLIKSQDERDDSIMKTFQTTYKTLYGIYDKHRRRYGENSYDSQQMCLMWSTDMR